MLFELKKKNTSIKNSRQNAETNNINGELFAETSEAKEKTYLVVLYANSALCPTVPRPICQWTL